MEYVRLGTTGMRVSRVCLGMMSYGDPRWRDWVLDENQAAPFVQRAVELGVNFFDTADMYSDGVSEEVTGRLLRRYGPPRDEVVVATKVFWPTGPGQNQRGLSRKHVLDAVDASLRRLDLDYIDLYQIHRLDPDTPVEETMEALHDVVRSGRARYIGASSMWAWQFATYQHTAERHGWTRFVTMQNHYNLLYREEEREMLPLCRDQGVGVIPWSPLARGLLAGTKGPAGDARTARAATDGIADYLYDQAQWDIVDRVRQVADRRGHTPAQVALAWLLHQPAVTAPVVGATKLEHLEQAVGAVDVELSAEDLATLEEPYRPQEVRGHF